jgi:hypothetical protein
MKQGKKKLSKFSAKFREIILEFLPGRTATIAELDEVTTREGLRTVDPKMTQSWFATQGYRAMIRREARKRIEDDEGVRREVFNVIRKDKKTGEVQQFFVFDDDIERQDLQYVIKDRARKRAYYDGEMARLLDFYESRFGKKARTRFERQLGLGFVAAN